MHTRSYDIVRTDALGQAIWIEAVADMDAARAPMLRLAERFPSIYLVVHQPTARIVAKFHFKPNEFRSATLVAEGSLTG